MKREEIVDLCNRDVLDTAVTLFGTNKNGLKSYASYEGCQNIVYEYESQEGPRILRISYRPDRPITQIRSELHFINYLADHGVRVARPVPSQNGNLIEPIQAGGVLFLAVSFVKGKGMRVPDNGYRYREGVSIDEYCQNWGQTLGQMHALAKQYEPIHESVKRPEWFELDQFKDMDEQVPERFPVVRDKFKRLLAQIEGLPKGRDAYGLIHGDFNDGNFTVDYDNGNMTVFDFDDAHYGWFMYELACAWEGSIGRAMFKELAERRAYMDHYFAQVLEGYNKANSLSDEWLNRLPLFLQLIHMEEFLHYARYVDDAGDEMQAELNYRIHCIENDIPYLGFFDEVFSPQNPFSL